MSATRPQSIPATSTPNHRPAVLAGFFGWTLDAFDYFLVVYCLTAIGRDFHQSDEAMALSLTLTLAFRPVGAFLFGLLADRYGRRLPLMLNLVFYSIVEVLSGLAPNYTTFMLLRALFGIGMGGQWGVSASLAMEKVPARIRGLLSGVLQQGYAAGNLLAGIAFFFLFDRIGWRPLFFLGGLPALLAVFVWYRVEESEVWQKTRTESWSHLFRAILAHWKVLAFMVVLMTCFNFVSHGTQDMYPTFLQRQWGFSARERAAVTAISAVGAIFGGTLFGLFSDRMGRRRAMITALLVALLVIPIWAFAPSVTLLVVGAFLMQFMVQGAWGVIPAHLSELSPDSVRGFLPGFGYQCGVLFASSVAYLEAASASHSSYSAAMAGTAARVFAVTAVAVLLSRERLAAAFGERLETATLPNYQGDAGESLRHRLPYRFGRIYGILGVIFGVVLTIGGLVLAIPLVIGAVVSHEVPTLAEAIIAVGIFVAGPLQIYVARGVYRGHYWAVFLSLVSSVGVMAVSFRADVIGFVEVPIAALILYYFYKRLIDLD